MILVVNLINLHDGRIKMLVDPDLVDDIYIGKKNKKFLRPIYEIHPHLRFPGTFIRKYELA